MAFDAPGRRRRWVALCGWALLLALPRGAAAWVTTINGVANDIDYARAMVVDAAGNAFATGFLNDVGGGPFQWTFPVVKVDGTTGTILWRHDVVGTFGSLGDEGRAITLDESGDVLAAGYTTNLGTVFDFTVVKLANATGDVIWQSDLDGTAGGGFYDGARDVIPDGHGDVLAAGGLEDTGVGIASDFAVVKLAGGTGAEIWRATIDGTLQDDDEDYANAVAVDAAGDAIAAGTIDDSFVGTFAVVKVAGTDGAILWRRDFQAPPYRNYPYDVAVDDAGDAVTVGLLGANGFAAKVRGADGSVAWEQQLFGIGGSATEVYQVAIDAAGDAYVAGMAFNVYSGRDLVVWKFAGLDGHEIWRRAVTTVGDPFADDYGWSVVLDGIGNVAVSGSLGRGVAMLRLRASDGKELMRHVEVPDDGYGFAGSVAFDPAGDILASGGWEDETTGTENDFLVTKTSGVGPIEGCGNGVVEPGEECDDGNDSDTDACLHSCMPNFCVDGVAIVDMKLKLRGGVMKLQGRLAFGPGGVPGGFAPSVRGAQLLLEDPLDFDQLRRLDLTTSTHPIPPASAGACGEGDGWTVSSGTQTYANVSGATDPPACTPGSAAGLASLRFDDRTSTGRGVRFRAVVRGVPEMYWSAPRLSIVLGGSAIDAANGVCGLVALTDTQCQRTRTTYKCK